MAKKIIAMIPARLEASRFPHKLLKKLDGKSILQHTYERVKESQLFDDIIVVCDHQSLKQEIENIGGTVFLSKKNHESGTDRIAEAAEEIDCDIIVNIQGDEPFIETDALKKIVSLFINDTIEIASLMTPIYDEQQIHNPNCVKVVTDNLQRALYFSRSPIPYYRNNAIEKKYYKHIGVYAFTKKALLTITQLPTSSLENIEKLENLRILQNGTDIYMGEVAYHGISIDTPEDFENAQNHIEYLKKQK